MKYAGYIYAIAAALTWGLVYTIDQKILTKISPLAFLFLTSVLTFLLMLPLTFSDAINIKTVLMSGRTNAFLLLLTSILAIGANYFILSSIQILDASTASVFEIVYPFFVIFLSYLFFGQRLTAAFALGATLIFLGSFIIIRWGR